MKYYCFFCEYETTSKYCFKRHFKKTEHKKNTQIKRQDRYKGMIVSGVEYDYIKCEYCPFTTKDYYIFKNHKEQVPYYCLRK